LSSVRLFDVSISCNLLQIHPVLSGYKTSPTQATISFIHSSSSRNNCSCRGLGEGHSSWWEWTLSSRESSWPSCINHWYNKYSMGRGASFGCSAEVLLLFEFQSGFNCPWCTCY
jgi:hypothetical protein